MCGGDLVMYRGTIHRPNGIAMYPIYLPFCVSALHIPLVLVAFCCNQTVQRCAYADTVGVELDCCWRLRVISVCGSNLSHRLGGKSLGFPARMLR